MLHAYFVKIVKLSVDSFTFRKGLYANYTCFCECILLKNNDISVNEKQANPYKIIWASLKFYGVVVAVLKYCLVVLCCSLCGFIDAECCYMALVHRNISLHYMNWGLKKKKVYPGSRYYIHKLSEDHSQPNSNKCQLIIDSRCLLIRITAMTQEYF